MADLNEEPPHSAEQEEEKPESASSETPTASQDATNKSQELSPLSKPTTAQYEAKKIEDTSPLSETKSSAVDGNEILGEQFQNYLRIAQAFLKTLKRPKDIEICTNLLRKVQRLNDSIKLEVKRNNNHFFRYYLKVLKWTSENQPLALYQCLYHNQDTTEITTEARKWLEDNRSYMALKQLKDGSTVIYAAIADDPVAGWQDGGLDILAKRGACLENS